MEKAADYIFWVGPHGELTYVNESTCARLGYSRDELLGMTIFDVDPEVPRPWETHWAEVKRQGAVTFETVHRAKDGEIFPVEVSVNHHEFGGNEHHYVFSRDISSRRRAEDALKQSERMLREAQVVANLGSYELDIATGSWASSHMLDVVFGIDETFDRSIAGWLALVHLDDRQMMADYFREEVVGSKRPFDKEYRIVRHRDGVERWVHGRGRLELDDLGRPVAMLGTIQDITERRQAEEAFKESEERLRQGQRLEAVGRLAGGIAHDFNNLLTAIIGQTELLRTSTRPCAEQREGLGAVLTSAHRAAALTRQLLAFSRRQPLRPRTLNVNEVAESMTGLLRRVLGEDIELDFRGDPALWAVEADPGQLEQVIMNLAVNARDAMPEGGRLTIETSNVDPDPTHAETHPAEESGPYVRLTVSDGGCGMPEDVLARVFEPFFTTKEPGKGTGLGLSTAYGIVTQSGGTIRAESVPGRGSTFEIRLPRAERPIDWSPADTIRRVGPVPAGAETVLVVEDEPAVLSLTTRILQADGYRVLSAGSPAEAVALLEDDAPAIDLILTDVVLPGMSGRAMVESLAGRPGIAPNVIYMSGYARDAIVHDGRLDEGIAFLEKPFTPDGLVHKVREVLDSPSGMPSRV